MQRDNPIIKENSKATLYSIVNTLQYLTTSLGQLNAPNREGPDYPLMTAVDIAGVHSLLDCVKVAAEVCFEQACAEEKDRELPF